ncbi:hypothetical protein F3I16_19795 [Pseudomonas sp. L-22-4S-12]|uniref:hypothetical protein n=1 Tax=Pseudomonas sp. L-22-4S-12 TaxID=2610893 RepID=UPI001327289B|nr:hypothetical protein [Pseudomonas sp. L-22-4S-12]MWV18288.1 hypothetical protein [Pseudomonas sp. L-22-4S-12]
MELPDTVIRFAESIGSVKCRHWSKLNRSFLAGEYKNIKDLQRAGEKISNHLERLIEKTVELDEAIYKNDIDSSISYECLFDGKLPKIFSELEKDIWFIPFLKKDIEQWKLLEKNYNSLRISRSLDSNYLETRRGLIKNLRKEEEHFKWEFIRHLNATKKSVIEQRYRAARHIYSSAFRPTKSEIDSLRKTVYSRTIGLGVESTYKDRIIYADDVLFDEHTRPPKKNDKYALYIPGWSLNGAFTDSD